MTDWKTHAPKYDGHAPDDWDEGMEWQYLLGEHFVTARTGRKSRWLVSDQYKYRAKPLPEPKQPDLLAQCLALPQADRDALIAELQKPVRDWADDVWADACKAYGLLNSSPERVDAAAVIRSMCLSNHDPLLSDIFNFLGGIDGAAELRGKLLKVIKS